MKNIDIKTIMLEHSKAKVELYSKYLSRFLNILARNQYVNKIFLFDLMCGEGEYSDGTPGSPIAALTKIKEHYFSNKNKCPNISIWFNDNDESSVEPGKMKIDRIKKLSTKIFQPSNVNIEFTSKDFSHIIPIVISRLSNLKNNEKALVFIDPYGYKEIKPQIIKSLLSNKNS